jgi:hypothetical protein
MSRNWVWDKNDDAKVMLWAQKTSYEALLNGDNFLASEVLRGASNFFLLRCLIQKGSANPRLVHKWLWGIHSDIYEGVSESRKSATIGLTSNRSVVDCLQLINKFFDLNNLHNLTSQDSVLSHERQDLIIPEPYENDDIKQ